MSLIPGLMSYSYTQSFEQELMTAEKLVRRVEELQLKTLEWCHFPCHEPGNVDWGQVRLLDRLAQRSGIKNSIAGFAPLLAGEQDRQQFVDMVSIQLDVSKYIGAKRMRFHGMTERTLGIGPRPDLDRCIDNLKRVLDLAHRADIVIALENHMDFTVEDFETIFEAIDSPLLAVNLDTGNLLPLHQDVLHFAERFLDHIVSCHFKGVKYVWQDDGALLTSCPAAHSIVPLDRVINILKKSRQDLPVHIEILTKNAADEDVLVQDHAVFLKSRSV